VTVILDGGAPRDPDRRGGAGVMWRIDLANRMPGGQQSILGYSVLSVPGAHPMWHAYYAQIHHLRPMPDGPPAHLNFPGAEYEIYVFAMNPDSTVDLRDAQSLGKALLHPPNLARQFGGVSEEDAVRLFDLLMRAYVDGFTTPDTDFSRRTAVMIESTLDHLKTGHGGKVPR